MTHPLLSWVGESGENLRRKLDKLKAEHDHAIRKAGEERTELERLEKAQRRALKAQQIAQGVAEAVQQQAHRRIAAVVTRCLKAVFGEDAYEFRIDFSQKRGKTEAKLLFVRDGVEIDPTTAAGGGCVDVAAFALRLACLVLSLPRRRRLLVLDEPFRFVSREYRPAVRELLLKLAEELGVQIIMVTHMPDLMVGNVIEIGG